MPASARLIPQFKAVWPPYANIIPSGLSFSITDSTYSALTGNRYTLFANLVSVWIVAMFGLIRILFSPSSCIALRHWLPE
jgi:hypothetical protein